MKSVLISINSKWCELIASGKKTVELRKTRPKCETLFKCYIYETKGKLRWCNKCQDPDCERPYPNCACFEGQGKVIGEFVCDEIHEFNKAFFDEQEPQDTDEIGFWLDQFNLSYRELCAYVGLKDFYGWHISDLVIYDKPRELSEFFVWKKCNSCRVSGYESTACIYDENCKVPAVITRPPQSWCYVESEVY